MTFHQRKIYPHLLAHLKTKPITVITGMRRTGKTTLVNQLLQTTKSDNKIFFDLQKLSNRDLFSDRNYDNIILELKKRGLKLTEKIFLGIDEVQLMPSIIEIVKYLYDHYDVKFIITGSSSYYLKNLFTESLAGRKKIFELFPLDFGEFLEFKQVEHADTGQDIANLSFSQAEYERLRYYYEEFIEFGGFPEVVLAESPAEKKDLLEDIISSYLNIDIKNLIDFRESSNLRNLIKVLAARVGSRLDYSKLASLTGLSRLTIMNYLDLFESTYLIARLSVHTASPNREIVKAKKLYFHDTGLLGVLAEISSGAKFENAVFAQLRGRGDLRYYALRTGQEIDFVLNRELALEAKETPTESDARRLLYLTEKAKLEESRLIGRQLSPTFSNYLWAGEIK